jgi:hypothetical protein
VHDGFTISDVVWLRNMAQAEARQRCGEDGFIYGIVDGSDSARSVHDEGVEWLRRKVWLGLERLRTGTWY